MKQIVISERDISQGATAFGPVAIPQGIQIVGVSLDRSAFAGQRPVVELSQEISLDGGVTWVFGGACQCTDVSSSDPRTEFVTAVPSPELMNRQLRGTVTLSRPGRAAISVIFL